MTAPCQNSQQLIEDCQGLVRSLATRIHRHLPPYVDLEDLIAYGQVGLAEAARDFDPARGIKFSTFAYYRIRGTVYDGLAKMTWFSRPHYHRVRYEQMADELLRVESEEENENAWVDADLQSNMRWFRDLSRALTVVYLTTHGEREEETAQPPLIDQSTPAPPAVVIGRETRQMLHQLVEALPAEERDLIRATYFDELTLQEAGRRLGISKSWASRLHAKALKRLGRSLRLLGVAN
jgi:RNA polymerase sigma factor for flagellar operon FliA